MVDTAIATKIEALATLRPGRQWICFDKDKTPISPITLEGVTGALVEGNKDWASCEEAVTAWQANRSWLKGIGREFIKSDKVTGIDLDDCIDDQGNLSPYASYVVKLFNSYTEYSPSERGLHIWVYGSLPSNLNTAIKEDKDKRTEAYDCKRYFTITGNHLPGTPTILEHRQEQLDAFHLEVTEWRQVAAAPRHTNTTRHKGIGDTPYGLKALEAKCAIVATTLEGGREKALNEACLKMGSLIAGNELTQETVERDLRDAARRSGLTDREIDTKFKHSIPTGMKTPRSAPAKIETQVQDGPTKEDSQALKLVIMAQEAAELFSTSKGERYARLVINGRVETLIISEKSGPFKRWLIHTYLSKTGNIPNATALSSAISVLEAEAQFGSAPQREVHIRVAYHKGKLYLDLGNDQCEVVEISGQGWVIKSDVPVEFRRPNGMLPLPRPIRGGSLEDLRPFVNVADEDWILTKAWLVGAFHPTGPYPILDLNSERGSAKSTTTKVLRMLFDPSKAPLRKEPKDDQTFAIMAYNNYVVAFDNLSHISSRLSDNMCTLATGAGDAYRSLYTNDEEHIFDARRPQVFNGIEELATRGDLIDRCIILKLPEIDKAKRRDERTFWNEFNQAHPRILGALLDAVSTALKNLAHTHISEVPRMADFALWVQAAESALSTTPGAFLAAYEKNREEGIATEIEASPVGNALLTLMKDKTLYDGLVSDLLAELKNLVDENVTKHKSWPQNARSLSGLLKRLAPSMRARNIYITQKRTGEGSNITITHVAKSAPKCSKNDANSESNVAKPSSNDANLPTLLHTTCEDTRTFNPPVTQNVANNGVHSISASQEKREEREEEGVDRNMGVNLLHFATSDAEDWASLLNTYVDEQSGNEYEEWEL